MDGTSHPLTKHRKDHGLSLGAAAERWKTSKPTLWRIENGKQKASPKLARALSQATGIPAKEIRPDLMELMELNAEAAE